MEKYHLFYFALSLYALALLILWGTVGSILSYAVTYFYYKVMN